MGLVFKASDFKKLGKFFGAEASKRGSCYRFEIHAQHPVRNLVLEIYPSIPIGNRRGNLVSVYSQTAHIQLHFCSGYVISSLLGEVTFVGEEAGRISGLIIEKEGGCSLYANVDRKLLSGDFTQLGPEVMLSGIALSLTDSLLDGPGTRKRRKSSNKRQGRSRVR